MPLNLGIVNGGNQTKRLLLTDEMLYSIKMRTEIKGKSAGSPFFQRNV